MTVERMVELLEIKKECVLRNATGECNRYCAGCDLLQDDSELHEMYTEAIALLKAQKARVMAGAELTDAELIEEIRKAPIVLKPNVDAVPHGRWEERRVDCLEETTIDAWQSAKCTNCGKYHTTPYLYYFTDYKFCPNCGAKMDGERRNNDGKDA